MKDYLSRMYRYVAWADRRTLDALRATPAAQAEALPLLAHLLAAEHVWLARLTGRDPRHAVWPTLDLDACDGLATENAAGFAAFVESLAEERPTDMVRYRSSQGHEFVSSVLDILTHVITHGPYHRGQIARIIGRHGGTPISTDFILFTWETAPRT
ncbi:MAG: DinB family protein [Pirellulales bacterium]